MDLARITTLSAREFGSSRPKPRPLESLSPEPFNTKEANLPDFGKKTTPTGIAPSADPIKQTRRKVIAGRGVMLLIAGVAAIAFGLYAFAAVYGLSVGLD
ncbi:hypothetical protein DEM27_23785 [Metarhizobium album]|uniref:Uncharacterized protein n=1 Tax=Metarhizobium album TaxID=2182425 RepID=A0A2U2DKV2_9HYPH|nr:hypothetical protein DEM27_23785 [Rhizobium album]